MAGGTSGTASQCLSAQVICAILILLKGVWGRGFRGSYSGGFFRLQALYRLTFFIEIFSCGKIQKSEVRI